MKTENDKYLPKSFCKITTINKFQSKKKDKNIKNDEIFARFKSLGKKVSVVDLNETTNEF